MLPGPDSDETVHRPGDAVTLDRGHDLLDGNPGPHILHRRIAEDIAHQTTSIVDVIERLIGQHHVAEDLHDRRLERHAQPRMAVQHAAQQ